MDRDETHAIISRPDLSPEPKEEEHTPVLSKIVSDTLALARRERRFKVGEYEWCEPDYRQILIWAGELALEPEEVIRRILDPRSLHWDEKGMRTKSANWDATTFREGRIVKLNWDLDLLAIREFRWIDDLEIEYLRIVSEPAMSREFEMMYKKIPLERRDAVLERDYWRGFTHLKTPSAILSINISLPKLQTLICERLRANELILKQPSCLKILRCGWNRLKRLHLTNVPMLRDLDCSYNGLDDLRVEGCPLHRLECSGNRFLGIDDLTNPELRTLNCSNNDIGEMDLSGCPKLEHLECYNNFFEELDIRSLHNLINLEFGNDALSEEDGPSYPQHIRLIQRPEQHFAKS